MNATAPHTFDGMPVLLRSEAFAEDLLELAERAEHAAMPAPVPHWLVNLAPLAVAMLGLAFAVVPPLMQ